MTIKVTVIPTSPVITITTKQGGPATNVVTVSTQLSNITVNGGGGGGASSVGQLTDVDVTGAIDGATLVYNANTHKYVVEQLPASDLSGNVDGGLF